MNSGTGLIAPLVQSFFTDHLVRQRRASPQTVASYRDTFRLLLQHRELSASLREIQRPEMLGSLYHWQSSVGGVQ